MMSQGDLGSKVKTLLQQMTQEEKIGQLCQVSGAEGWIPEDLKQAIKHGHVGSVINEVDAKTISELQRIAVEESRLGIPLLTGRDVIHGFKTIFPIPLGQAASWSPELVEQGACVAAKEASSVGINWTFAPMIDISRDPRWGRIAESLGEDPYLCAQLGTAMVRGFQGCDLSLSSSIAACAKHFCGYGASESGKDYCATNIPENELRNVHMVPFKAAADAGVCTFMASFSDIDGIPASGNQWLMDEILRKEWEYQGFVVSDWESISQLTVHGLCENSEGAAIEAFQAGVDMEMVGTTYKDNVARLVSSGRLGQEKLDTMVARILQAKFKLGLFEQRFEHFEAMPEQLPSSHLALAKQAAIESCVLLQNNNAVLPLNLQNIHRLTVVGPLADDGYEQLGTWIFDGDEKHSVSLLSALKAYCGTHCEVDYHRALSTTRSKQIEAMAQISASVQRSDVTVLVLGEEAILSGEAHCRTELNLPGCQETLIDELHSLGKPIVLVVLAGRPLTLENITDKVDAILFAWHPGTMGGPAITELLFGVENPSGKLPVTFPRKVGQIPIYYGQKPSGKPVAEHNYVHMDDIPVRAPQTSLGMAASHLDTHFTPLYPFGFGLSYSLFEYSSLSLSSHSFSMSETLEIRVKVFNVSDVDGIETAQLYIQDIVGSITRPPKELKGFQRVRLGARQSTIVSFHLTSTDLAFYGRDKKRKAEPGRFKLWVGPNSASGLEAEFVLNDE